MQLISVFVLSMFALVGTVAAEVIDFEANASFDGTRLETNGYVIETSVTPSGQTTMAVLSTSCSPQCAYNGTFFLFHRDFGDLNLRSIELSRSDGSSFTLRSFDAAEFQVGLNAADVIEIIGYRADGSTVNERYLLDGLNDGIGGETDFESFSLPADFKGLVSVSFFGLNTDGSNDVTRGFSLDNVQVLPDDPKQLLANLAQHVLQLNLKAGLENAFDSKLQNALDALDRATAGDTPSAIGLLYAFIGSVEAQSGKAISETDAANLIFQTNLIIELLEAT